MTPNALLNLLHRGTEYLTLRDVGVLVFDECHKARKKHPYARVMGFYLELSKQGAPLPRVGIVGLQSTWLIVFPGLPKWWFGRGACPIVACCGEETGVGQVSLVSLAGKFSESSRKVPSFSKHTLVYIH